MLSPVTSQIFEKQHKIKSCDTETKEQNTEKSMETRGLTFIVCIKEKDRKLQLGVICLTDGRKKMSIRD